MGTNTPNLNLYKPDQSELMNDPQTQIDPTWTKIQVINDVFTSATAPTNPAVGSLWFRTPDNSLFICMLNDPNWGIWWKPVNRKYGAWVDIPNINPVFVQATNGSHLQRRICIDGTIEFRGALEISGYPTTLFATDSGHQYTIFSVAWPVSIAPMNIYTWQVPLFGINSIGAGSDNMTYTGGQFYLGNGTYNSANGLLGIFQTWNPNNTAGRVYFDGVRFACNQGGN